MNWHMFGFSIGVLGLLFGLCWRWAVLMMQKLAVARQKVSVVDQPPNGLSPAEVGMLLNGKLTMRELTATLLDLQARQIIQLEAVGSKLTAHLINSTEHASTKEFESLLLSKTFTRTLKQRELSSIDKETYTNLLVGLQNTMRNELIEDSVYAQPPRIKRPGPILLGFVIICVVVGAIYGLNILLPGSASIVLAIAGLVAGWWLANSSRLSHEGVKDLAQIEAFKRYLSGKRQKADHDRYQSYLAYAFVLGVEKQWATKCSSTLDRQLLAKLNKL